MPDTLSGADQATDSGLAAVSPHARAWALFVACLGVLLVVSSMVGLNTALPDIALATAATQNQLTWIVDGYTLALACLLLPAGALGDRYGRRGAMLWGLIIFAAASVAPAIWPSPTHIIVARAAAGAGAALIMPATLSLLTAAYPKAQRNKAVGVWAGAASSGAIVGMLGSGALLRFWSWQTIFWGFAAAAVVTLLLTLTVGSSKENEPKPLDWLGAVIVGGAVAALVLGILEAPIRGWSSPLVLSAIAVGLVGFCVFGIVEVRSAHPLLDVRLFAVPAFATGAATITILFLSMFGFMFVVMQYLQLILGYSPLSTAFALIPLIGPMLVLTLFSFWYLPRAGLRLVVFAGLVCVAVGFACLGLLDVGSTYWDVAWPMLIMSAGIGLCTAPSTSMIMTNTPDDKQGVASAVNDTAREIGAALGIALAGSLLASLYANALRPALADYPDALSRSATESLIAALEVARHAGPAGADIAQLSRVAFVDAMGSSLVVIGALVAACAVAIGLWAPGREDRQLAIVERFRGGRTPGRHRA